MSLTYFFSYISSLDPPRWSRDIKGQHPWECRSNRTLGLASSKLQGEQREGSTMYLLYGDLSRS